MLVSHTSLSVSSSLGLFANLLFFLHRLFHNPLLLFNQKHRIGWVLKSWEVKWVNIDGMYVCMYDLHTIKQTWKLEGLDNVRRD
ncbi:hypothetical protein QVD17_35596 [Tagetes erecta]|uniref:Uncharacterized protein n=1 Tax=Tagetes erecta TaxID=13708 RepID=A0AAD8JR21_TARER|nr:hypothetical protein QVD17_35596 [Tagetes erecta]